MDTSKLDSFNTPFRAYDDIVGKELGMLKLQWEGQPTIDANGSVIDDISGSRFRGFQDSCWILLTSQRPSVSST